MRESQIQSRILLALSEAGCTIWRCETAGAWVGKVIHKTGSTVTLSDARMIQAGLAKGGADLIGIQHSSGRMVAIEVKTPTGRVSAEQERFLSAVRKAGGIAGVARSVEDALQLIQQ